jgi:hypothetical protein
MIPSEYLSVLRKLVLRLEGCTHDWVVTGSVGMALQGMPVEVHDIDLQTDRKGAYEIERLLKEYVVEPVRYRESNRIRSHLGKLEIESIRMEIIGDVQKRIDESAWEAPVTVEAYRQWVEMEGMRVPVLSLAYEYQAYLRLGRTEKAEMLRKWLEG